MVYYGGPQKTAEHRSFVIVSPFKKSKLQHKLQHNHSLQFGPVAYVTRGHDKFVFTYLICLSQ